MTTNDNTTALNMEGQPVILHGTLIPCGLTAAAAAVVATIAAARWQGIRPYLLGGALVWASEEEVGEGQVCRPTLYWDEDGEGGASYVSPTGEVVVSAAGRLTVRSTWG